MLYQITSQSFPIVQNSKYSLKFHFSYKKFTYNKLSLLLDPSFHELLYLFPRSRADNKLFKMAIRGPTGRTDEVWWHLLTTLFYVVISWIGSLLRCYVILSNRSRVAPNAQLSSTPSIFFRSYKRGTQKRSFKKKRKLHRTKVGGVGGDGKG